MAIFDDIEEVEDWLEPLDYLAFWEAVEPYRLFSIADRDHCDGQISSGKVPAETILRGIKGMAVVSLRDRFELFHRKLNTPARQGTRSIH